MANDNEMNWLYVPVADDGSIQLLRRATNAVAARFATVGDLLADFEGWRLGTRAWVRLQADMAEISSEALRFGGPVRVFATREVLDAVRAYADRPTSQFLLHVKEWR